MNVTFILSERAGLPEGRAGGQIGGYLGDGGVIQLNRSSACRGGCCGRETNGRVCRRAARSNGWSKGCEWPIFWCAFHRILSRREL